MLQIQKLLVWLRWPLALGIVGWLFSQHRDGVERLSEQSLLWPWLLLAVAARGVVLVLSCVRWCVLVRAQEIPFPLRDSFRLGFLSNLLNYVVPGTIGGDVTKVVLVARENPNARAIVAATVVLDRVLGLLSLMLLGCASVLAYPALWVNPQLLGAILLLAGASCVGLAGMGLMLHRGIMRSRLVLWVQGVPRVGSVVRELVRGVALYQSRPRVLLNTLLLSFVMHVANCATYYCCALGLHSGGKAPSFGVHLVLVPVAEIAAAVLPLPGGIGVREGAMQYLYGACSTAPGVAESGFFAAVGYSVVSVVVALLGGACLLVWPRAVSARTTESREFAGAATRRRAWLVDLDGTLYRGRPMKLMMGLELLTAGPRVWRIVREFRRQHEALREEPPSAGNDPFAVQIDRTADAVGCSGEEVQRVVKKWMFERPGRWLKRFQRDSLLDQIRKFRAVGGRTALVSDYPALEKLQALGVDDLFDVIVACGEPDGPEALKPSPDGYLKAALRLGFSVEDCLVIGDREDADGAASVAAGIEFCHVEKVAGLDAGCPDGPETENVVLAASHVQ